MAAGVLVVAVIGLRAAGRAVAASLDSAPENFIRLAEVEATPEPAWLETKVLEAAVRGAGIDPQAIPLANPDLVARLGSRLLGSPWVAAARVEKGHRALRVDIRYRVPVLCVPIGTGEECCYLDESGVLLPAKEIGREALAGCLVAEGTNLASLPPVGTVVEDARARTAARLASLLCPSKGALDLLVVEVRDPRDGGWTSAVRARNGTRIEWGVARPESVTSADREKLRVLSRYRERHGALEGEKGPLLFKLDQGGTHPVPLKQALP